jgi:hypothetical protein
MTNSRNFIKDLGRNIFKLYKYADIHVKIERGLM